MNLVKKKPARQKSKPITTSEKNLKDISMHSFDGWMNQFKRMIRWNEKVKNVNINYENIVELENYLDSIICCFQNIFYLKDWLLNSSSTSLTELNEFIEKNKEIGLCRDICNGTKHFEIKHRASIDPNFVILRAQNFHYKRQPQSEYSIIIITKTGIYSPHKLAAKCIRLWKSFILKKKLISLYKLQKISRE